jgi:1-aminocyclopropane-1-carboxylate deaminase/D-cysteine desulfhydrase-like pyridoxal-dependent ACC family enzyme
MILGHEKVSFLHLPTPLDFLPAVSEELGINLYVKRDDMTGFGTGGNKLRKLEYILHAALKEGATALVTVGGPQTNHGRLTAAVAAKFGLKCTIVAVGTYPGELSANLLLDRIMGCEVYLVQPDGDAGDAELEERAVRETMDKYREQGDVPFFIPLGGSSEIGILGYYECAQEIAAQAEEQGIEHARVITAVGSEGTYMGLFIGMKDIKSPIHISRTHRRAQKNTSTSAATTSLFRGQPKKTNSIFSTTITGTPTTTPSKKCGRPCTIWPEKKALSSIPAIRQKLFTVCSIWSRPALSHAATMSSSCTPEEPPPSTGPSTVSPWSRSSWTASSSKSRKNKAR